MFKTKLQVPQAILQQLNNDNTFEAFMQLSGRAFRDVPGRKTSQIMLDGKSYFIKQHFGVGWGEIIKSFLNGKKPIISAMTEVAAIQKLDEIGIPTTPLVAYGQQGCSPANIQSFVLTADLGDIISLEDLCADWQANPPDIMFKQRLMIEMAKLAAKLHGAGLCHRDFYLCHLVLKKTDLAQSEINLVLIDLHRMLMNQPSNGSAAMKDIAGLVFSAIDSGFTQQDWTLFKQHYLPQSDGFWMQVEARAQKLHAKFKSDKFQKRLSAEKSALD
jgi:heptose I phosphotransferase